MKIGRKELSEALNAELDGKLDLSGGQMSGHLRYPSSELDAVEVKKGFAAVLPPAANAKIDIEIPVKANAALSGTLEVTLTTGFDTANATGSITKVFHVVANQTGVINVQQAYYKDTSSHTGNCLAISDIMWSSEKNCYIIKIAKIDNSFSGSVKIVVTGRQAYSVIWTEILRNIRISDSYTTDSTIYPKAIADKTIYQSGSNANGHYVRYGDGTQICYSGQRQAVFGTARYLQFTWNFPATFTDLSNVSMVLFGNPPKGLGVNVIATLNLTQCAARYANPFVDTFASNDAANMFLTAIGRWK